MAVVVTDIGNGASGVGATVTIASVTVPAGSLIVIAVTDKSNAASGESFSDGGVNTYTAKVRTSLNGVQANGFSEIFYAWNSVALSAVTLTYTKAVSGSAATFDAFYVTGIQTSSDPYDTAAAATATGSSATPSVTSGTPAAAGDLFVGVVGAVNPGIFTQDSTNAAWAAPPDVGNQGTAAHIAGGNVVNSGSGTRKYAPTYQGTSVWADLIVAFKAASSSTITILMGQAML